MPLGRICPETHKICACTKTGQACRPGGKRLTPRRRLNQKVWAGRAHRRQRLRIFARDDYRCVDCGHQDTTRTGKGLIADHVAGIDAVREFDDRELATRCPPCSGRKDGRRKAKR